MTEFTVSNPFKIGSKMAVTLYGNPKTIRIGTVLRDENGTAYTVCGVAMGYRSMQKRDPLETDVLLDHVITGKKLYSVDADDSSD